TILRFEAWYDAETHEIRNDGELPIDIAARRRRGRPVIDERRPLRVSALATFPIQAAATRFRVSQFIPPLRGRGIDVTFFSFLTASDFSALYDRSRVLRTAFNLLFAFIRRLFILPRILRADVLFLQR